MRAVLNRDPTAVPESRREAANLRAQGYSLALTDALLFIYDERKKYPSPSFGEIQPAEWHGARKALDELIRAIEGGEVHP